MQQSRLTFTIIKPGDETPGATLTDIAAVLEGVQSAMGILIRHQLGLPIGRQYRIPDDVRDLTGLRLVDMQPGSATLAIEPDISEAQSTPDERQAKAFASLLAWDGTANTDLPSVVTETLHEIPDRLSDGTQLWMGHDGAPRRFEIARNSTVDSEPGEDVDALLEGWLKEVNLENRTAQLYRYGDGYTSLKFDKALDDRMHEMARQYVKIRGVGRFNAAGDWTTVRVDEVEETRSMFEPQPLDEIRNNPNPKRFDPDKMVTASEPFDVEEFNRFIRESRDVGKHDASGLEWLD